MAFPFYILQGDLTMDYVFYGAACLVWLILGILIGRNLWRVKPDGTFKIDQTDEIKDQYSLDFETSLDDVEKKSYIIFRVKKINSQKNSFL